MKHNIDITEPMIQETFYNQMLLDALDFNYISLESLQNREPFVYIGLSCQAIVSICIHNANISDVILTNGRIVTLENCPQRFQGFFTKVKPIKKQFGSFTKAQIQLIRFYATTDPEMAVPEHLLVVKTPSLMKIVSEIIGMGIEISSLQPFKDMIEKVILFLLDCSHVCAGS
jgi:hypothetical protein